VAQSSITEKVTYGQGGTKRIVLVDCGCKHNIVHSLLERGVEVVRVPWDYDFHQEPMDGLFISNGPGNPKTCKQAVLHIRRALARRIPIFGICMGHQLLALAAGANTYKLKYGHRSQNQPVREEGTHRCLITSQNHSFAVDSETIPNDWEPWFTNLNDQTNEGIRHKSSPFMSVQFHPEAMPGPFDAGFLFDRFVNLVNEYGPADTKRS
jgi:carbamoyl-phosphate synthase small subunit